MIDLIGDIHGYADELENLLQKLGYVKKDGVYTHPKRKVLFVGDYIDRGPKIRATLQLVKSMTDHGSAIALMGNHEYNALCFHFDHKEGGHLRPHYIKNILQHYETLNQFQNKQEEYEEYIEWFKTLPLFYEDENFRAVHACWEDKKIEVLKNRLVNNRLTDELIYESVDKSTELHDAVDQTLKGKEIKLPDGISFKDKDENIRTKTRIKWWEDPAKMTYHKISFSKKNEFPDTPIDLSKLDNTNYYKPDHKPVFFGHYWLKGKPLLARNNICCLDYSVADEEKDGGRLAAYRFDGESVLDQDKFVYVERQD